MREATVTEYVAASIVLHASLAAEDDGPEWLARALRVLDAYRACAPEERAEAQRRLAIAERP